MRHLKTMDGNAAAAHVAYAFSEVAAIYPITPSSPMAENMDEWVAQDRTNIFGEKVNIVEMQSEAGAAGAVHGAITSGSYTTTFTASQGLLLMIPNMYKIAGEFAPAVFHVSARALATHALNIFGDHSDVMACRQTGFAMLCSNSVQQVMDLAAVAHLATIAGKLPMLHFFDGFRTSHEQQKVETWDYDELASMVDWDAVKRYKANCLHPTHGKNMGSAEQPETFFQHKEASNTAFLEAPDLINEYMKKVNAKIGTDYKPFNYYGAKDATEILVAMGSVCECAEELIDYLNAKGKKVGIIEVHLYRPWSTKYMLEVMPKTVKSIAVLDRTKEPGSIGEPLYLDVVNALRGTEFEKCFICGGRYGLGSKDVQPGDVLAAYENLWSNAPKKEFTLSIIDDVTNLSVSGSENPDVAPKGTTACKFWGLGSDGTVGANKNSVKIIGDHTDLKAQAYFQYDSKKSGGVTISHLRFGKEAIRSTYYVKQADFVACHNSGYLYQYDMVQDVKKGGTFLLNCVWSDAELEEHLPAKVKKYIAENDVKFYTCNAVDLAKEIGLGARRTNSILQAAFFKLANIIPIDEAVGYMKEAIKKSYGKKGQDIVDMNCAAIDAGLNNVHEVKVPASWKTVKDDAPKAKLVGRNEDHTRFINDIMVPTNCLAGDSIPVSKLMPYAEGNTPNGTAAFEKRGVAADVPTWDATNCIQCNQCAYVCPHAVIRPFAMTEAEANGVKDALPMTGNKEYKFTLAISALDCTGCGSCAQVCPAKVKALKMVPVETELVNEEQAKFNHLFETVTVKTDVAGPKNVKASQFLQPLMEFSGACPGCGETPYAKLMTQLFGDRMFVANATGCSSIWGNSAPATPYTVNKAGRGPAWSNSLFEDNAEFGFGMQISMETRREEMKHVVEKLVGTCANAQAWIDNMNDAAKAEEFGNALVAECAKLKSDEAKYVVENKEMLIKPSVWILGGDGWAYDIGYGGLDHVLAADRNVNVLVFDTEVYSNTGGQASKSTPSGSTAKFAAAGKSVKKKDLAAIAMSYGYVYVAQIAMGANQAQTLKAFQEAEAYDGPSLIIAYAPCINHGIKKGMDKAMQEMKEAVTSGYWNLFRFNPDLALKGENPLTLDSGEATTSYRDFIMGEVRYNSLMLKFPERAEELFTKGEKEAKEKYESLVIRKESLDK